MKTLAAALAAILLPIWTNAEELDLPVLYHIEGVVPVEMQAGDEYGVMLVNDGGEEDPSPRYIIAIAKTRTVVDTKDLDLFRAVLKRISEGATIFRYDSCTVPRSWGLRNEHFDT